MTEHNQQNVNGSYRASLDGKQKKWLLISTLVVALITIAIIIGAVLTSAGNKEIYKVAEDKAFEVADLDANQLNFSGESETKLLFREDKEATVSGWIEGHEVGDDLKLKYDYKVYVKKADSGEWEVYDYMLELANIGG